MASRPYSIYPHGLTIEKSEEGVNYPAGSITMFLLQHTYLDTCVSVNVIYFFFFFSLLLLWPGNHSHSVQPGEMHTYTWKVVEEDEPLDDDARCLTRVYHSAVDTPRDIASGLIGPLLICKSQSLNVRNVQVRICY